jgi:hypothetical protein
VVIVGAVPALAAILAIVADDGSGDALALIVAVAVAVVTLLACSYIRRGKEHRKRQRQEIRAALEISKADDMTPEQFEQHCRWLLMAQCRLAYFCHAAVLVFALVRTGLTSLMVAGASCRVPCWPGFLTG